MAEVAGVQGLNSPPGSHFEFSATVVPSMTIDSPPASIQSNATIRHPITQELLTPARVAELRAWALQKNKVMGMDDRDELGNVTDYVYAGAIAFEDTIQMRNLLQKRRARPLQLRRAITINRQQNAQACIAFMCGRVAAKPCGPCGRYSGPFTECVIVEGSLLGACASCHYGGEGNRCTFHVSKFQKKKRLSQVIPVEDSEEDSEEGCTYGPLLPMPKKRGQWAVPVEQSGSSAGQSPRKSRKQPWSHFELEDMERLERPPKKQKAKPMEPRATQAKANTPKAIESNPMNPQAEPVPSRKETLRKAIGMSKDGALKMAKHYMYMATRLMEDSEEE